MCSLLLTPHDQSVSKSVSTTFRVYPKVTYTCYLYRHPHQASTFPHLPSQITSAQQFLCIFSCCFFCSCSRQKRKKSFTAANSITALPCLIPSSALLCSWNYIKFFSKACKPHVLCLCPPLKSSRSTLFHGHCSMAATENIPSRVFGCRGASDPTVLSAWIALAHFFTFHF